MMDGEGVEFKREGGKVVVGCVQIREQRAAAREEVEM
jgi:hypothetical protein